MAWCHSGDKPLSGPMMAFFTDAYMRHSVSYFSIHKYSELNNYVKIHLKKESKWKFSWWANDFTHKTQY